MRNDKNDRTAVYYDNIDIFKNGSYVLRNGEEVILEHVKDAPNNAKLYKTLAPMTICCEKYHTHTSCHNTDTVSLARKMVNAGNKVAVLNLASGYHACGGYDRGAKAQEECLCRSSTLSLSLYSHFNNDMAEKSGVPFIEKWYPLDKRYGAIYSKDVEFFRANDLEFYTEPFVADVITIGALNFREGGKNDRHYMSKDGGFTKEGEDIMLCKIRNIYRIALENGADTLILGAFGCGVYKLRDDLVAKMFHDVLTKEFPNAFNNVMFAIYGDIDKHKPFFDLFN